MPVTKELYFFPVDATGQEGAPIRVWVDEHGVAQIDALPEAIRSWVADGVQNHLTHAFVTPADGNAFLEALACLTNASLRFRRTSEPVRKIEPKLWRK